MPGKRQEYRPPENPSLVRTPCRPWTKWFSRGKSTDKLPHQPPMARQPQAPPPSHSASRSAPIITHLDVPRRPPRHDEMYDHFLPSSIAHPPPPPPPKRAAPAPPPPKRAPPPPPKPEAPLSPPPAPLVQTPFQITAPAPLVQTPFQITAPAPPLPKEIAPLTPVKPPSVPRSASNASLLSARTASLSHPLRQYQSHDASDCEDDSTATVSTCSTIPEPMRKFVNSDWTALAGFVSTRDDEADVMPGDTVRVEWVWSDGWAWGQVVAESKYLEATDQKRLGREGAFPLSVFAEHSSPRALLSRSSTSSSTAHSSSPPVVVVPPLHRTPTVLSTHSHHTDLAASIYPSLCPLTPTSPAAPSLFFTVTWEDVLRELMDPIPNPPPSNEENHLLIARYEPMDR